ncbi:MAG: hypothetical protein M3Q14_02345 [bacterium]|nr:hypothetical protein [bacterium]
MKKLLILTLILATLSFGNAAVANTPDASESPTSKTQWSSYSMLNDIQIPDEILMDIQMEYQGFAVTKATKVNHNGADLYQLKVDRSDIPVDYDGFYLYFDKDWKMVEKEDIDAPAPVFRPAVEESKPQPEPEQEDTSGPSEEVEQEKPIERKPNRDPAPQPEPEPAPEPVPEPTPDPEPSVQEGSSN